jgi:hypothetical protein
MGFERALVRLGPEQIERPGIGALRTNWFPSVASDVEVGDGDVGPRFQQAVGADGNGVAIARAQQQILIAQQRIPGAGAMTTSTCVASSARP